MNDVERAREIAQWVASDDDAMRHGVLMALRDPCQLVRLTAGIRVASQNIARLPDQNIREIADSLLNGRDVALDREYAEATTTDEDYCDLEQDLALALAALPAGSADDAIVPLIEFWQTDRQFYESALAAIALAFGPTDARTVVPLTREQRFVLAALTESEPIWTCCGDTVPMLAARGLPKTRESMIAFLSGASGPVADE